MIKVLLIHNFSFRKLIKNTADLNQCFSFGFLCSATTIQILVNRECQQLKKLIIKKIDSIRFNYGLLTASSSYYQPFGARNSKMISVWAIQEEIGYRASTAVPFYFYDLNNDLQTSLKIHPVVADESGLMKISSQKAFKKLIELYENLPTSSALHAVSFSNAIFNVDRK